MDEGLRIKRLLAPFPGGLRLTPLEHTPNCSRKMQNGQQETKSEHGWVRIEKSKTDKKIIIIIIIC